MKIIQTLCILVLFSFVGHSTIDITRIVHPGNDKPFGGEIHGIADGTAGPFEVTLLNRVTQQIQVKTNVDGTFFFLGLEAGPYELIIINKFGCEVSIYTRLINCFTGDITVLEFSDCNDRRSIKFTTFDSGNFGFIVRRLDGSEIESWIN